MPAFLTLQIAHTSPDHSNFYKRTQGNCKIMLRATNIFSVVCTFHVKRLVAYTSVSSSILSRLAILGDVLFLYLDLMQHRLDIIFLYNKLVLKMFHLFKHHVFIVLPATSFNRWLYLCNSCMNSSIADPILFSSLWQKLQRHR